MKFGFVTDAPNKKWLADFTYIWTAEGWLYAAAVMDLYSRRIVGWSMSDTIGACQGSCRLIHAAIGCLSAVECAAITESRSGLRVTGPVGVQSRVGPDQRAGLRSRALRYSAWRAARMV